MRIRAFLYAGYATNPRDATSRNLLSIQETSTTSIGVERRGCLTALPVPYFTFYRKSLIFSPATYWSQVKHHFFLWKQIISTRHLSQARKTRSNHGAVMPAMDTLLELCAERRALRAWADKGHPFCQDEKTLKSPTSWIIGLICSFLYCQWHCGQRIAPANRGNRFAHNKKRPTTIRRVGSSPKTASLP